MESFLPQFHQMVSVNMWLKVWSEAGGRDVHEAMELEKLLRQTYHEEQR
jgi:hypothetical protein